MATGNLLRDLRLLVKFHTRSRVEQGPLPELELGHQLLDYDPERYAERLLTRPGVQGEVVARFGHEGRRYPTVRVRTPNVDAPRRLLVCAGIHGNERAGILAIPTILDDVAADPSLIDGVHLDILTPVNPVGAAMNSRYNAAGFDLNRDFIRFETREARIVRDVMLETRPSLVLSLHEGPQEGSFLICNDEVDRELALALVDAMAGAGVHMAEKNYFRQPLSPAGYDPATPATNVVHHLWGSVLGLAASTQLSQRHRIPEIVLESPWTHPDPRVRIQAHRHLVLAALRELRSSA